MKRLAILFGWMVFMTSGLFGSVTGSISGTVRDPSGAVVPGVSVTALNTETAIKQTVSTDAQGFYAFPSLPVGHYEIDIQKSGFRDYRQTGLVIDVNTALRVDATLEVGAATQQITVSSSAFQVETTSTQMGEVIGSTKMLDLPLNGRSYTDLLALQPGVVPEYSGSVDTGYLPAAGVSGNLFAGYLSVSGGRETANGFTVNGANVQEGLNMGTAIIPNLDSIAEFRIITNNSDAEYGNYSGGQVNAVTKSGTNQFHGDAFEFLRNTDLDARNFYSYNQTNPVTGAEIPGSARGAFHQNQFGGTFGGPIVHDKVFFFVDYQGTRQIIGVDTGLIPVPSAADRTGNLSDVAGSLTGTVTGPAFASTLAGELGYPVTVGEAFYTTGCTSSAQCVFPNAVIPQSVWSHPVSNLMKYIPTANVPGGYFSTSAYSETVGDDKGGYRIDGNSRWGMLSAYYFIDNYSGLNPYAGASTPGFPGTVSGRAQLLNLGDTKSIGPSAVNEFHLNFMRNAQGGFYPTTVGPTISSLGFTTGCNTLGICVTNPGAETVPSISFNNFSIGGVSTIEGVWENTFQALDNFSKITGTHSLKFGGDFHVSQVIFKANIYNNGVYSFNGSAETGLDFADFLLGASSSYAQGVQLPLYSSTHYLGLYAQDHWRVRRTLTINYGLRWDVTTPWYEKYNRFNVAVPGEQSVVFPTSPAGWIYPLDPGIPRTVAPIPYDNLGPRIGVAYSPDAKGGVWRKLTGGAGKTSVRASFGKFFTAIEDYGNVNANGDAPFGFFWASPTPPMLSTPFVDLYTGNVEGQRFYPLPVPPPNVSPAHPDPHVNFAQYEPISSSPSYFYKNRIPYAEDYLFSLQRQFGANTMLSLSNVGTQGHHLLIDLETNPSIPSVCLSVSQPSEVAPGSNTCGPNSETGIFTTASGQVVEARQRMGPAFGSDGWWDAMANSNYNAFQASLRHTSGRMSLLAGYTYSKSLDQGSEVGGTDQVNPFNYHLTKALSAFDMRHNFVVSYGYQLPFDKFFRPNRLTQGWIVSGVTHFSTGLPITMSEMDDHALIGNNTTGPGGGNTDEPNYTPGPLLAQTNPRKGGQYFNTSLFSFEAIGQLGNSPRRFFSGPGINNWDLALLKDVRLTESKTLELRGEFFNIFNHAQFGAPSGDINNSAFGVVTSAGSGRIAQIAAKFIF